MCKHIEMCEPPDQQTGYQAYPRMSWHFTIPFFQNIKFHLLVLFYQYSLSSPDSLFSLYHSNATSNGIMHIVGIAYRMQVFTGEIMHTNKLVTAGIVITAILYFLHTTAYINANITHHA